MCYSAMVWQALAEYLRVMGATPDLQQFEQLFAQRLTDKSIRIPRGFERNFDNPKSPAEKRIKDLIDQHRSFAAIAIEQELFAQKTRLAEAERKLKVKETKTALKEQRVATSLIQKHLERLALLNTTRSHADDPRVFPASFAPVILRRDGANTVVLARYQLRPKGEPAGYDKEHEGLYCARSDNLWKFRRQEFGRSHALMVIDSFYENVERDGKKAVLHFTPRPPQAMLVACLYSEWGETQPERMFTFAAITDDPPAEIAAAGHNRCVVNIKRENVAAWLQPEERTVNELQGILTQRQQPYYEHQVEAA